MVGYGRSYRIQIMGQFVLAIAIFMLCRLIVRGNNSNAGTESQLHLGVAQARITFIYFCVQFFDNNMNQSVTLFSFATKTIAIRSY